MFSTKIASFVLLASLSACSQPMSSADQVRASISETWNRFTTAWLAGDANTATSAFFTVDAINTVPEAPESRSRDAINTDFGNFHKSNKVTTIDQRTEELEVAGDLAYERGTFTQTIQAQEGATQTQHSRYLAVWKRQPDGSWKCHRFLFNNAPKPS